MCAERRSTKGMKGRRDTLTPGSEELLVRDCRSARGETLRLGRRERCGRSVDGTTKPQADGQQRPTLSVNVLTRASSTPTAPIRTSRPMAGFFVRMILGKRSTKARHRSWVRNSPLVYVLAGSPDQPFGDQLSIRAPCCDPLSAAGSHPKVSHSMQRSGKYEPSTRSVAAQPTLLRGANDNALVDRTLDQVDAIGFALIGFLGMFGVFLLSM